VQGLTVAVCLGLNMFMRVAQATACMWLLEDIRCGTFWLFLWGVVGVSSQYYVYLELQPCTKCR